MRYLTKTPWIAAGLGLVLLADDTPPPNAPPLSEVLDLIRSNLTGVTEAELNRAAVDGLMDRLSPRAALLSPEEAESKSRPGAPLLSRTTVFDDRFGYLRISRVEKGLHRELEAALSEMIESYELEGLVIDLRFANGRDYREAARVADRFVKTSETLIAWGDQAVKGSLDGAGYEKPVLVLTNRDTSEAAEALAAVLREFEVALILGNRTAGQASVFREFSLSDGSTLRLAVESLRIADRVSLSDGGVDPDIVVSIPLSEEREYYADPYADPAHGGGGGDTGDIGLNGRLDRPVQMNEAALVRMKREALDPDVVVPDDGPVDDEETPLLTDPALARAVDLLTGLAVMRTGRE